MKKYLVTDAEVAMMGFGLPLSKKLQPLPPGARVLTREEVGAFCFKFGLSVNEAMLDELFGEQE